MHRRGRQARQEGLLLSARPVGREEEALLLHQGAELPGRRQDAGQGPRRAPAEGPAAGRELRPRRRGPGPRRGGALAAPEAAGHRGPVLPREDLQPAGQASLLQ